MKVTPTSGPMASSNTHQAREATSSRYSFFSSQRNEWNAKPAKRAERNVSSAGLATFAFPSGKRKKHLFEVGRRRRSARRGERHELIERAFAAHRSAAQQHESIAHARRVRQLMNRQEHRPAGGGVRTEGLRHVAALPE